MDDKAQLKLQAYLDGELPEGEARELATGLAQDQEAAALLAELRQTRDAIAGSEQVRALPESREFYWSKIQRAIERAEAPAPQPAGVSGWVGALRRFLVPVTGLALLVVAGFIATRGTGEPTSSLETAVSDPGALVYRDYSAGATFVWLSYPAEDDNAKQDDEALFD
jgi:anti-sigma factor RsiW